MQSKESALLKDIFVATIRDVAECLGCAVLKDQSERAAFSNAEAL